MEFWDQWTWALENWWLRKGNHSRSQYMCCQSHQQIWRRNIEWSTLRRNEGRSSYGQPIHSSNNSSQRKQKQSLGPRIKQQPVQRLYCHLGLTGHSTWEGCLLTHPWHHMVSGPSTSKEENSQDPALQPSRHIKNIRSRKNTLLLA